MDFLFLISAQIIRFFIARLVKLKKRNRNWDLRLCPTTGFLAVIRDARHITAFTSWIIIIILRNDLLVKSPILWLFLHLSIFAKMIRLFFQQLEMNLALPTHSQHRNPQINRDAYGQLQWRTFWGVGGIIMILERILVNSMKFLSLFQTLILI